jgi:hypothetical protein
MRSVLLYVFLVGVPVLAISGILRVGQRLRSPIFVEGTWNVERASNTGPDSSCGCSLINADRTVLTVSQSGSHLLVTLNDENRTTFAGKIRNATITATIARPESYTSPDAQGFSSASIQLNATVEREGESDRLLGAFMFYDCPTSTMTSFSAKRQVASTVHGQ